MTIGNEELTRTRGHCPNCGAGTWADVRAEYSERQDDGLVWSQITHRILQCRGCERVYHQQAEIFSEDQDYERDPTTGVWTVVLPEKKTYWPSPGARDGGVAP